MEKGKATPRTSRVRFEMHRATRRSRGSGSPARSKGLLGCSSNHFSFIVFGNPYQGILSSHAVFPPPGQYLDAGKSLGRTFTGFGQLHQDRSELTCRLTVIQRLDGNAPITVAFALEHMNENL